MSKKEEKLINRKVELLDRTKEICGLGGCSYKDTFFSEKKSSFWINTLKVNDENIILKELAKFAIFEQIPWNQRAYVIKEGRDKIIESEIFKKSEIYIQNASSLVPVLASGIQKETKLKDLNILDTCSAPGGKLINIAQTTQNKALIIANDADHRRISKTKDLTKAYGANIGRFYAQPAQFLTKHIEEKFDYIFIDAPCSGEGLINIDAPESLNFWSIKKIKRLSKLQKRIIIEAEKMLKPGGKIIYSTCTWAPEENEEVISEVLDKCSGFKILDLELKIQNSISGITSWNGKTYNKEVRKSLRVIPNDFMEAFFVCVLAKETIKSDIIN